MKNKLNFLEKWFGWYLCIFLWSLVVVLTVSDITVETAIATSIALSALGALAYSFWIEKLEAKIVKSVLSGFLQDRA